jgi:quercetin dioxygenase-like cupin family protein
LLLNKQIKLGDLRLTIYDFEEVGDELPIHNHAYTDVHISIVAKGSFRVWGKDFDKTVVIGSVLDWQPDTEHGFQALEQNSRLVNIIKNII